MTEFSGIFHWNLPAGQYSSQPCLKEPKDIDEAIHSVRWCQHVRQVVFGKTSANNGSVQKSEQQSGEKQVQGYQEGCTENQEFSHKSKRNEVLSSEEHIYWGTTEGESDKSPEGPDSEIDCMSNTISVPIHNTHSSG